ncbi:MAG: hypothetical protein IZT56_14430, partial [Bacteroidetes bacterium]|nr:hypothetical protein [Bacteroidota bacterium]
DMPFGIILIISIVFLLILITIVIYIKRNKGKILKRQITSIEKYKIEVSKNIIKPNSVFLFGDFTAINNSGKNISYLFSPRLKQLFVLLLLNSLNENSVGISSEEIYSVLWPEKSIQKAKNLKNVILSQLRNIIDDIDGVEIIYKNRKFVIVFEKTFYFDYLSLIEILENESDILDSYSLVQIIQIMSNGVFLQCVDLEYFDKFKKDCESLIFKIIPEQLKRTFNNNNYDQTIQLGKILVKIDPLNELAFYSRVHSFIKLGLFEKAKKSYNSYIIDYKKIMGDDFDKTFREVSSEFSNYLK